VKKMMEIATTARTMIVRMKRVRTRTMERRTMMGMTMVERMMTWEATRSVSIYTPFLSRNTSTYLISTHVYL
jgi:hypothetical protein